MKLLAQKEVVDRKLDEQRDGILKVQEIQSQVKKGLALLSQLEVDRNKTEIEVEALEKRRTEALRPLEKLATETREKNAESEILNAELKELVKENKAKEKENKRISESLELFNEDLKEKEKSLNTLHKRIMSKFVEAETMIKKAKKKK